jgi:hypothetical protein
MSPANGAVFISHLGPRLVFRAHQAKRSKDRHRPRTAVTKSDEEPGWQGRGNCCRQSQSPFAGHWSLNVWPVTRTQFVTGKECVFDDRFYRRNADVDLVAIMRDAYRMALAATSGWKIGGTG